MTRSIKLLVLFLFVAFFSSCDQKTKTAWISVIPQGDDPTLIAELAQMTRPCNDAANYIPDSDHPKHTSIKRIKVNFHVIRNKKGKGNFSEEGGRKFIKSTLFSANNNLKDNLKMKLPVGNNTPVIPARYKYELWPTTYIPGDDGIYFHNDEEFYFVISRGFGKNNYDQGVFKKYGIQKDTVLNVIIQDVHVDSLESRHYKPISNGIAFSTWIKGGLWYYAVSDTVYTNGKASVPLKYRPAKQLNHEIGHVFGLSHAWGRDKCDDTPTHPNCWSSKGSGPCAIASNNIMDYNANMGALTPCQIGRVHKTALNNKVKRSLLIKDWCIGHPYFDISINEKVTWNSCKTIQGNLTIENGGKLIVRCKTSFPQDAVITVHPGGELVLQGAHLYNDCGGTWKGIKVLKKGKEIGKVSHIGKATKIENCEKNIQLRKEETIKS